MTTHRRAWTKRAGVVVALVAGALLTVPAAAAQAAPPPDVSVSPSSATVQAGGSTTVSVTVGSRNPADTLVDISLTGLPPGVSCTRGCGESPLDPVNGSTTRVTISAAGNVQDSNGSVTVQVTTNPSGANNSTNLSLTVKGAAAPPPPPPQNQTVREVSGKVVNEQGVAIANASVQLSDSAGHTYYATTSGTGTFRFLGTTDKPITPGSMVIGAAKNDVTFTKNLSGNAGQSLTNQRLQLNIPGATPSPGTPTEAVPTDPVTDEATPAATDGAAATAAATASKADSGGMGSSWLLILVGGLLVALGVGAIVLLWMRRRDNDDEDGDGDEGGAAAGRRAYHGPDQTRAANRAGADPTMVGRPSLADAPTMMHSRPLVDDEFPDPYGAPLPSQQAPYGGGSDWAGNSYAENAAPTQVGYGAAGYGNAPGSGAGYGGNAPGSGAGYGGTAGAGAGAGYGGNAPGSGAGYGANAPGSGAGYGAQQPRGGAAAAPGRGYDEPTGRYTGDEDYGQPADPYQTGSYDQGGSDRGYGNSTGRQPYGNDEGYDQRGGYGQAPGQNGYQGGDGYGQQSYGAGQGGYDQRGGYGGARDQRGGYPPAPDDRGGYPGGQGGHARDDRSEDPNRGGGRRSLDWLDD